MWPYVATYEWLYVRVYIYVYIHTRMCCMCDVYDMSHMARGTYIFCDMHDISHMSTKKNMKYAS